MVESMWTAAEGVRGERKKWIFTVLPELGHYDFSSYINLELLLLFCLAWLCTIVNKNL